MSECQAEDVDESFPASPSPRCPSVSVGGLRCQYPDGHQASHGCRGAEWSIGRDSRCTCDPKRPEGRLWYAHQPGCPLREIEAGYSERWQGHGDLIRTQLQETGRVRLSFITLADLWAAVNDLGIDADEVGFYAGYAVVGDAWKSIDSKRDLV